MRVCWKRLVVMGAAVCALIGCSQDDSQRSGQTGAAIPTSTPAAQVNAPALSRAQPKLPTMKLWLGPEELTVELATTPMQVATGMMFRTELADTEGMLFVFRYPHRTSFYMKNTTVPLSCAYIDPEGIIREIHDLHPLNETPVEASRNDIQYVLEVPQGWFQRKRVGLGTLVRTERGSLADTFASR